MILRSLLAVAAASLGATSAAAVPAAPRFVSEVVRIRVAPPVMQVTGTYHFVRGAWLEGFPILYPFARDSALGPPEDVTVEILPGKGLTEEPHRDASGLHVTLPFERADACTLVVRYTQELRGRRAVYLVTSTQEWRKPLDRAVFELEWPDSLGVPRTSFPFQRVGRARGTTRYRYQATRFLPTRELVVEW